MLVAIAWVALTGCAGVAKEATGATAGSSGGGAPGASGTASSAGKTSDNGGSAGGSTAGATGQGGAPGTAGATASAGAAAQAGAPAAAGASAIACDWDYFGTDSVNEAGIGAGCTGASTPAEVAACGANFCTRRVLADRWPASDNDQVRLGHCTKHCQADSECGSGFTCCEARPGPFCLRYQDTAAHGSGCSERCSSDHLGCAEGEICCERMGKICISDSCQGVCVQ
jgi:hypothetical protein